MLTVTAVIDLIYQPYSGYVKMVILTWSCAPYVRVINRHYIFRPFSPQIVNCGLAEGWAHLAMSLDAVLEVLVFLHYRPGELTHKVNHALSCVICEFHRRNVPALLRVLITRNPLFSSGLEPLPSPELEEALPSLVEHSHKVSSIRAVRRTT